MGDARKAEGGKRKAGPQDQVPVNAILITMISDFPVVRTGEPQSRIYFFYLLYKPLNKMHICLHPEVKISNKCNFKMV